MHQRLRVTATHLCRIFLAPHLNFNIRFQYSLVSTSVQKQVSYGVSPKRLHIFHTSCTHWFMKLSRFNCWLSPTSWIKSNLSLSAQKAHKHTSICYECFCKDYVLYKTDKIRAVTCPVRTCGSAAIKSLYVLPLPCYIIPEELSVPLV